MRVTGRLSRADAALLQQALDVLRDDLLEGVPAGTPDPGVSSADCLVAVAETALAGHAASAARSGADRHQVVVHVDAVTLRDDAAGRCGTEAGEPLAAETVRRLACDASIVPVLERDGQPVSVGRRTRAIPAALRRALRGRDGGCRFPGCSQRRHVDAHHIRHWAHGGATDLDNLVELCRRHHVLLHEGTFTASRDPVSGAVRFARPDGSAIPEVPEPRVGSAASVVRDNERGGVWPTPFTATPRWDGERLGLGAAVDAVLGMRGRPAGGP